MLEQLTQHQNNTTWTADRDSGFWNLACHFFAGPGGHESSRTRSWPLGKSLRGRVVIEVS